MANRNSVTNRSKSAQRSRERSRPAPERRRADVDGNRTRCPECSGEIIDGEQGDLLCADCGLVVDEEQIDAGPEWRAFTADERAEKSRVGAPVTPLMHDKGLSTTIGWQDVDSRGSQLSNRKRRQLSRLRTWDERFRTKDAHDRNLKHALGEIDRMASALGVPKPVRETASVIYRRALDEDLLPGRSIEGMSTASLYAAARLDGVPRSIEEVTVVSRVGEIEIQRAYRYLVQELELEIPPTNPREYLGRIASDLECSNEVERLASDLIDTAVAAGVHSGKHPVGIAASAVYAAGMLANEQITQSEVSDVAQVSEVTIRNRYREVLKAHESANTS